MVACQQGVLALGWLVGAAALRLHRRPVIQWAGYALLTGASILLFVWAARVQSEAARALGNLCTVAGFMLMQRGVRQFVGRDAPAWVYAAPLGLVAALTWFGMGEAHGPLRVAVVSGLLGVLCIAAAWDVFVYARDQLELRWGFGLALPLVMGALVFLVRSVGALLSSQTVLAGVTTHNTLNISSALAFLITALVLHLTLVALVGVRAATELRRLSRYDSLTELLNRRAMDDLLHDEARRALRTNRPFSVLMVDADYFKSINDGYGHAAGDQALRHLAQMLRAQMRDIDRVGRFGGEEFIILLPGTSATEALHAAERLRDALFRRPWVWQGESRQLTVSTGVAAWRGPHDSVELLLKRADAALYRAKALGRNRFEFAQ